MTSMNENRTFFRIFFVLVTFGSLSLLAFFGRAGLAEVRGVDALHLIGAGMCFGGAIVALGAHVRGRKSRKEIQ